MKKKIFIIFCVFLVLITIGLGFAVNYLFNYAVVVSEKDFIKSENKAKFEEKWVFAKGNQTELTLKNDGLKLKARYVTQPKQTSKTKSIFCFVVVFIKNKKENMNIINIEITPA